jgi:hypothetical protein
MRTVVHRHTRPTEFRCSYLAPLENRSCCVCTQDQPVRDDLLHRLPRGRLARYLDLRNNGNGGGIG